MRSDDHIARYSATIASIPWTRAVYLRRHRTQSHMPAPELCGPIDSSVILQPACPNGVTAANMLYRVNEHRRSCKRLFHGHPSYFPVKPISSLRLKYYGSSEGFRNINAPRLPPVHPLLDPVSTPTIALVLSESNRSIQLLDTPLDQETKSFNTNIFNTIDRPTTPKHQPQ